MIYSLTASTIMRITYGIEVSQSNDEYIKMAEKAGDNLNRCAVPGSFIVDFLPISENSSQLYSSSN